MDNRVALDDAACRPLPTPGVLVDPAAHHALTRQAQWLARGGEHRCVRAPAQDGGSQMRDRSQDVLTNAGTSRV